MKNAKKFLMMLFCFLMFLFIAVPSTMQTQVAAAAKKGLVKSGSNYYYYSKGKKVKNKWVKVKSVRNGKTITNKYYFGKNGKAYKAVSDPYSSCNIAVKKIKGKTYGFDRSGKMAAGVRTTASGKIYVFKKNGTYDSKKTKALKKAIKNNNLRSVQSCLGKYLKCDISDSCLKENSKDYVYYYDYVTLTVIRNNSTGNTTVYELYTR